MALTGTHITTNGSTTDTTSYNSAGFTPGADELVMVAIASGLPSIDTGYDPTLSGGGLGAGWTQLGTRLEPVANHHFFHAFWGISSSPGASAALNFSWPATMAYCLWSIMKFAGVDPTTPLIVANTDGAAVSAASHTLTLPNAFGHADNGVWLGAGSPNNRTYTDEDAGSGTWLTAGQAGFAGQGSVFSSYRLSNDSSPAWSVNTSAVMAGRAVEIKAAQAATTSLPGQTRRDRIRILTRR